MKKRLLIPSLLLLSGVALSSCGSAGPAFVANGTPYVEGSAAGVKAALRLEKEDSVETVKISQKMNATIKVSSGKQKASVGAKLSGSALVNLDRRTVAGDYKVTASLAGFGSSAKVKFNGSDQGNGNFVITSGTNYEGVFDSDSLATLFEEASYTIYSWNYSTNSQSLVDTLKQVDSYLSEGVDSSSITDRINSSFVFSGSFESGTFDIGLGQSIGIEVAGVSIVFNKFLASYKDCFIQSSVIGMKMSYTSSEGSFSISVTYSDNFSYTYRNGNKGQNQVPIFTL